MKQQKTSGAGIESQAGLITELLKLFLHTHSRKEFMENCLQRVKTWADLSCAGIRVLDPQSNIPYQAHSGFSPEFVESEKWLSTTRDHCACIRVVQGKLEPQDISQMTDGGSFCCNDTATYLASLKESEKVRFRGVCIVNGYAKVAVIPISYRQNILGALHLVDTREGVFTPAKIEFLESSVASIIGEGIYRYSIEDKLENNLNTQTVLTKLLKYSLEDLTLDGILNLTLDLIHSNKAFSQEIKSAIFLVENEADKMTLRASRNFETTVEVHGAPIKKCDYSCGNEAAQQGLLFSEHDSTGNEVETGANGVTMHYGVPILFQKTTLGVIRIDLNKEHRQEESEEQFLTAVANTLAGIIWRKRSEELLRSLSLRLINVQEEERHGIALELHDQIGQMLTGLKLMIGQALRSNENARFEVLQEAQNTVTELIMNVREMSLNLRPSMLNDLGLLPALIWHFQRCKTQSNLNVDFRHAGVESTFSKDVAIAGYRIVQEALTNVMRYAGVNEVLVEVWTDLDWLQIRVEDKGKGFKEGEISPGSSLGLQGMRERAMLLGGNLSVDSVPGQGTVVFAQIPLKIAAKNVTISGD